MTLVSPPAVPPSAPSPGPVAGSARLLLFGAPTLVHGGRSEALPFERRSQLLVLLALKGLGQGPAGEGGWVGRSELATLLWPDQGHKLAATNLRKTIHRLQLLPWGGQIQAQGGALRFAGPSDVRDFESAIAERRLPEALRLRRGELLAGFDDDGNEAWTAWLGYERERQRVAWRSAALGRLAGALPPAEALALTAQLLEADPLDEAALGHQIETLARDGQVAAARQAYARFAERLADELGIEPGAGLRAQHDALGAPTAPPPRSTEHPTDVIEQAAEPVADEGLIGRGAELRRIASLLAQPECRLLVLVGPGGIGKTRLARRALQELAPGFADGGAFVSLEDATPGALGERLAQAVVGPAARGGADALSDAIAALRGRRLLLVLDNFETLAAQAAQLSMLLQACPHLKLLVTSRMRLALAEEWALALDGLPWPDAEDLDRLEAFDAVRLFVRTAQRVEPAFSAAAEAAAIVDICRLVEGLPLALELAAAWVRMLSCAEIAAELRSGRELLRAQDPSRPARHASLEQVFEQSWVRLAAAERGALAGLSVFRGGCTASAARAVLGTPLAVLASLTDKSLLHKDGSRLRLHPLVQQLAATRLDEARRAAAPRPGPAEASPERAHAAHYLQLLARAEPALSIAAREALQLLDVESENCRAAWQWAATAGAAATSDTQAGQAQARLLGQAARALMHHADHRGHRAAGLASGQWAAASPAAQRHAGLRAVLLAACAHLAYRLGRHDEALAMAGQALQLAPPADDPAHDADARLQALRVLGGVHLQAGRLEAARDAYRQVLVLADAASNPKTRAGMLGNLALVEKRAGHFDEALRLGTEALQAYRSLGAVADEALCLNNLGDLQLIRGDHDGAEACLQQALRLTEQQGLVWTQAMVLANLSMLALLREDVAAGRRAAERALPLVAQVGDRAVETTLRHQLAALALLAGEPVQARRELDAALRGALDLRQAPLQLDSVIVFALLLAHQGEPAAALAVLDFVVAHPEAGMRVQREAQRQRKRLLARVLPSTVPLHWPAGLDLAQLVGRIVGEMTLAHAPLLATLRGDAAA